MEEMTRIEALRCLLGLTEDVDTVCQVLARYPYDSEALVDLTVQNVLSVLRRYADGTLDVETVQRWAEAIGCREDFDWEEGHEDFLCDVMFRLEVPEINEPITRSLALRLLDECLEEQRNPTAE